MALHHFPHDNVEKSVKVNQEVRVDFRSLISVLVIKTFVWPVSSFLRVSVFFNAGIPSY